MGMFGLPDQATLALGPAGGAMYAFNKLNQKSGSYDSLLANQRQSYNKRLDAIRDFQKQLAAQRQGYKQRYAQLQSNAFNRFMPDFQASLASRGLQASGGAFASGLGRKSAQLQDQFEQQDIGFQRQDTYNVQNLRGSAWGAMFGQEGDIGMADANASQARRNAMMGALGQLGGNLLFAGMTGGLGGGAGAAAGAAGAARPALQQGYGDKFLNMFRRSPRGVSSLGIGSGQQYGAVS